MTNWSLSDTLKLMELMPKELSPDSIVTDEMVEKARRRVWEDFPAVETISEVAMRAALESVANDIVNAAAAVLWRANDD